MKYDIPSLLLLLAVCCYIAGGFLIHEDKINMRNKSIHRETVVYVDDDGEECEVDGLIQIEGFGSVLSYRDVYLSTLPFLIVSCILARVIFNSADELRFMIYTNCILGLLLTILSTKSNIFSTILYWIGIITASFANKETKHERKQL